MLIALYFSAAAIQLIVLLETVFLALFANRVYHTPTKADQPN